MEIKGAFKAETIVAGNINYSADAGIANAYVVSLGLNYLFTGLSVTFKAVHSNTGASTLKVDALAAVPIKKNISDTLEAGDISTGQIITVVYDGIYFQIASALGTGISGYSGLDGISGYSGYSGYSGASGAAGTGVNPTGPYNYLSSYNKNDLASYNNITWISLQSGNENHTPGDPGSETWWDVFANQGVEGISGYSGYSGSGVSGYSGYSGSGVSGYSGYSGSGVSGYSGYSGSGVSGYSGYSGSGVSGYSGYSGSGVSGYSGYSGSGVSGYSGYSGSGVSGYSGYSGSGVSGYSGYSGSGVSGYSGYSGSGVSGYSGYSGSGVSGYSGYSGYSGSLPFILDMNLADHKVSGIVIQLTAHENQYFGDACYINSSSEAQIADASVIEMANVFVMCADYGNPAVATGATGNYLLWGIARDDTWNWTIGAPTGLIYLSLTGAPSTLPTTTLTQTAPSGTGEVIQVLGVALTNHIVLFKELTTVEHN